MRFCAFLISLLSAALCTAVRGDTYDIYPGGALGATIMQLSPGDTLIVHSLGGNQTGRYGRFKLTGLSGDDPVTPEEEWITVKAAVGEPRPIIYYAGSDTNLIEFYFVLRYIKFQGLGFEGGSDAIKFVETNGDHIILEDLRMHSVFNTGINLSSCGDVGSMEVRYCEIFNTGITGHGEGMYLGTHGYQGDGTGILHDSIIEWNHVYDCGQYSHANQQGDGIELKYECYRNIVQDNVIHNTNYPGILSHGTALADPADNNILRRNVVWNCASEAIQTHQTTNVVNNVVFDSNRGIYVAQNTSNSGILHDVYIHNNTFYAASSRLADLDVGGKSGIEVCNNLFYQPSSGATAVRFVSGMSGITATNNYYYGLTSGVSFGFAAGPAPGAAFVNTSVTPGVIDLYLQSGTSLDGGGSNSYAPADDFNATPRPQDGVVEPGAYEITGPDNPGWQIDEDFKRDFWPLGDLNHDDVVDLDDYTILADQLTGPSPPVAYYQAGGSVVVEAEHYLSKTDGTGPAAGAAWGDLTGDGSLGEGYVQALPNNGLELDAPDIESASPRLSYLVYFEEAGLHYLFLKGWGESGNDDSVHFGIDGLALSSSFDDSAAVGRQGYFEWTSHLSGGGRPVINVPSVGLHTINLWMREDGARIDRIMVSTSGAMPAAVPAESDMSPTLAGDLDADGDCDVIDAGILTGELADSL
jgi:hypothetical protein